MKAFLLRCLAFLGLCLGLVLVGVFLPTTPRASQSLLMAQIDKDRRLKEVGSPRVILLGGSSLSFGFDSSVIERELSMDVVNTGIHAGLGARYMLESNLPHVREGDIVVAALEYRLFYSDFHQCKEQLLRMVLDVDRDKLQHLSAKQWLRAIPRVPRYAFTKFLPTEYVAIHVDPFYTRASFNGHGDAAAHWGKPKKNYPNAKPFINPFNMELLLALQSYGEEVHKRGATFAMSYPGLEFKSLEILSQQVEEVHRRLSDSGLEVLGDPHRYGFPPEKTFNSLNHLNHEGAIQRSLRLVEDLRRMMDQVPSP